MSIEQIEDSMLMVAEFHFWLGEDFSRDALKHHWLAV